MSSLKGLPPPRPIPLKERASIIFVEKGQLDVINGAFVLVDKNGIRTCIPIGGLACIMLEPGTRVSHKAVSLASSAGTLLIWVGEAGVRVYSAGQPGGARSDKLLYQAKLALDDQARLNVVRYMYRLRFQEEPPQRRSVKQLQGMEGARVKQTYKILAAQYKIKWLGRRYNPRDWEESDLINRCISTATSCLHGVTEAAVLAAGYAPAIGFLHRGKPLSFVYDIADLIKFETVVPEAFKVVSAVIHHKKLDGEVVIEPTRTVRQRCRDIFRKKKTLNMLIPLIGDVLDSGGLDVPEQSPEALGPAFEDEEGIGDDGHRR